MHLVEDLLMSAAVLSTSLLVSSNMCHIYCSCFTDKKLRLKKINALLQCFYPSILKEVAFILKVIPIVRNGCRSSSHHIHISDRKKENVVREKAKGPFKEIF